MENGRRFKGIVAAMITPFNDDESLDEEGLRAVVRFLVERGVHGLFPAGSQGEFYALAAGERRRVLEVTLDAAKGQAFMGRDSLIFAGLVHGAVGAVPELAVSIYDAVAGRDFARGPLSDEARARLREALEQVGATG